MNSDVAADMDSHEPGQSTVSDRPLHHNKVNPNLTAIQILQNTDYIRAHLDLDAYLEGVTKTNIGTYLAEFENLPSSDQTNPMMAKLLEKWGQIDGPSAFEYAKSMSGQRRGWFISKAATGWSKSDPVAAFDAIMVASNNGRASNIPVHHVVMTIASTDLRLASKLALNLSTNGSMAIGSRQSTDLGIGLILSEVNRTKEFQQFYPLVMEYSDPSRLGKNLEALFTVWSALDFEKPLSLIESIEDSDLSAKAMAGFLKGWANSDAKAAMGYALNHQNEPTVVATFQDIAISAIMEATADELDEFVMSLGEVEDQSLIHPNIFSHLSRADPHLALTLANSLEQSQFKDQSIRGSVHDLAEISPDEAEAYTRSIEDQSLRSSITLRFVSDHIQKNADPGKILSFSNGFQDPKNTERILSSTISWAMRSTNQSNSEALIQALREELEIRTDLPASSKEKLLDRLNKGSTR